jgi:predicted GNAT family acetyltransferase
MRVHRCGDAAGFLAATLEYRDREPLRTNVLGSVASVAANGEVPTVETFWWLVRDDDDRVVGAAMRTEPYALSLGPMTTACAEALAASVVSVDADLPAVAGFSAPVEAFLDAYAAAGSLKVALASQRQVLYAATAVDVPEVPGEPVVATEGELELAQQWYLDFTEEVDGVRIGANGVDRAMLLATVRSGRLRWWRDGGATVSMAGHAPPVRTPGGVVTRVGPVFTPPAQRGHGYAAVLTGRLTELLLARGSAVMLYADAANATSNGVYLRLGYTVVDELVRTPLGVAT